MAYFNSRHGRYNDGYNDRAAKPKTDSTSGRITLKARLYTLIVILSLFSATIFVSPSIAHGVLHLRVAHLSPTSPAVDIYVNGEITFRALAYPIVSSYVQLASMGEVKIVVVPAGGKVEEAVTKAPVILTFKHGDTNYYTAAAVGTLADNTFAVMLLPADGVAEAESHAATPDKGTATVGKLTITGAFARPTEMSGAKEDQSGHMSGMGGTPMAEATPDTVMAGMHMAGPSAVYFTITNVGDTADRLVKIETDAAEMATMHETKVVNEVAQMIPQPDGYEIPANGSVELKPGGKHIMLENLKRGLAVGDTVTLKLTFASGSVVDLVVPVLVPAP